MYRTLTLLIAALALSLPSGLRAQAWQGAVDAPLTNLLSGWACDLASGQPTWAHIYVGGVHQGSAPCNRSSASIYGATIPNGNCGSSSDTYFLFDAQVLGPGTHTFEIWASHTSSPAQSFLLPTNGSSITIGAWTGLLTYAGPDRLEGWACDSSSTAPSTAFFYAETPTGVISYLGQTPIGTISRPEAFQFCGSSQVGFSMAMPQLDPQITYTIIAFATHQNPEMPPPSGLVSTEIKARKTLNLNLTVPPNTAFGVVNSMSFEGATGWASNAWNCDPVAVDFYIQEFGQGPAMLLVSVSTSVQWTGLPGLCPAGPLGFDVNFPFWPTAGNHNVFAIARGASGITEDAPLVEYADPNNGWAFPFPSLINFPGVPTPPTQPTNPLLPAGFPAKVSFCQLGDVNQDGVPDFASGTAGANSAVSIVDANGIQLFGPLTQTGTDGFGWDVEQIDDLDGDGTDDLLVGAPRANSNAGMAYIYSAATGNLVASFSANATAGEYFGTSVASLGDVDGDGTRDFAIGAPGVSANSASGYVKVFSGANRTVLAILSDVSVPNARFGEALSSGDLNGDGFPDLVVGAPNIQYGSTPLGPGKAYVYSGTSALQLIAALDGAATQDAGFGYSLDVIADQDGDGFQDLAVGAPLSGALDHTGAVQFFQGGPTILHTGTRTGPRFFGASVSAIGDRDGDGIGDVAVAGANCIPLDLSVFILRGSGGGLPVPYEVLIAGPAKAASVGSAGDLDGDGIDELLIGGWSSSVANCIVAGACPLNGCVVLAPSIATSSASPLPFPVSTVRASDTSTQNVSISWGQSQSVAGYRVYRNGIEIAAVTGGSSTSYVDTPPAGTYSYSVAAYNQFGTGQQSAPDIGTRLATAAVGSLGAPCALGGPAVSLWANPPIVGQPWAMGLSGGMPGWDGMLLLNPNPIAPISVGPGCTIYLLPFAPTVQVPIALNQSGAWTLSAPLLFMNLNGVRVTTQAYCYDPQNPQRYSITNALDLTFGY